MEITSASNEKIKRLHRLQTSSRFRREEGLFVAEGLRLVREVPKDALAALFTTASFAREHAALFAALHKTPVLLSRSVFEKVSGTRTPQGVLAVVRILKKRLPDVLSGGGALLFLENLQDPGNLGAILRTAEAADFRGVILSRESVDVYNPKAVRAAMGSLFRVPVVYEDSLVNAMAEGKAAGYVFYAADLGGPEGFPAGAYPVKTALVIGNEGNGLSSNVTKFCDFILRIPMAGKVESLNAAVAASVLMYDVVRNRSFSTGT